MAKKKKNRSKSNNPAGGAGSDTTLRTDGPGFGALIQGTTPEKPTKSAAKTATKSGFDATWLILLMVALGVVLTGYLTSARLADTELAACGAGSSCDVVQSSRWSMLLGLPMALWGLFTYAVVGALVLYAKKRPNAWRWAMLISAIGVAISLYLQVISYFVIDAICMYCVASAVLITLVFVTVSKFRPARLNNFKWGNFAPMSTVFAALVVALLHMHFSGVFSPAYGPERPHIRGLAEHLTESGAKFYGAYWCPHCQQQKQVFEASVDRVPYIECSPNGRGTPMSLACQSAQIRDFPTWIIDGKRYTGVQSIERLSTLSGYKGAKG